MSKIYIIDDDRDIVESISIVLKNNKYEVDAQYDDRNLEANLKKFKPDLIILDVMFPEDSSAGFTIARKIKAIAEFVKVPIIMLSAINERGIYIGKFSNKDIDDSWLPINMFLEKPLNPKDLLEKVKTALGK
ncbi:MAG: Regulatory protein VanR [uncultured bacterium]|nr:MAG: Regulatory protein VanR [uncultured bacterium]